MAQAEHGQSQENSDDRTFLMIVEGWKTLRTLIKYGAYCIFAYFAYRAVASLAGQQTNLFVSLALQIAADVKFALTITIAIGAAGWAMIERYLRKKDMKRLHPRVKELEQIIDPNRSSSNLTPSGNTHPRDRRT